jgi:hypothetical protein
MQNGLKLKKIQIINQASIFTEDEQILNENGQTSTEIEQPKVEKNSLRRTKYSLKERNEVMKKEKKNKHFKYRRK